jgi:hypothetical protein
MSNIYSNSNTTIMIQEAHGIKKVIFNFIFFYLIFVSSFSGESSDCHLVDVLVLHVRNCLLSR